MAVPAAGTLGLTAVSASSLTLNYTAGAGFDHGTLYVYDRRRGTQDAAQAITAGGAIVVSGLRQDTEYVAMVQPEGDADEYGPATVPVVARTAIDLERDGDPILLKTKTERTDWQTYVLGANVLRANVAPARNGRGYEYRLRIEHQAQNLRMRLRGLRIALRPDSRGEKAETR